MPSCPTTERGEVMKIKVQLEPNEVVDDWSAFRDAFEEAARKMDLGISIIIHTDEELA
jgi:hypothetical protein